MSLEIDWHHAEEREVLRSVSDLPVLLDRSSSQGEAYTLLVGVRLML